MRMEGNKLIFLLHDNGQFIVIELKYKLKEVLYIKDHPFTGFGVSPSLKIIIIGGIFH